MCFLNSQIHCPLVSGMTCKVITLGLFTLGNSDNSRQHSFRFQNTHGITVYSILCPFYCFYFLEDPQPCINKTGGTGYKGLVNITESGKVCQRWDKQVPHQHSYTYLGNQENYCRSDYSADGRPWCYTTHNRTRYEYCYVPSCGKWFLNT